MNNLIIMCLNLGNRKGQNFNFKNYFIGGWCQKGENDKEYRKTLCHPPKRQRPVQFW